PRRRSSRSPLGTRPSLERRPSGVYLHDKGAGRHFVRVTLRDGSLANGGPPPDPLGRRRGVDDAPLVHDTLGHVREEDVVRVHGIAPELPDALTVGSGLDIATRPVARSECDDLRDAPIDSILEEYQLQG